MVKLQQTCNETKNGSGPDPPHSYMWQQHLKEQVNNLLNKTPKNINIQ